MAAQTSNRRQMLARSAALAGAAYVAPQVVHMSAAGAGGAQTCYAMKQNVGGACESETDVNDPSCSAAFNAAFASATPGGLASGCGQFQFANNGDSSATVTLCLNADVKFAGAKFGNTCHWWNQPGGIPAATGSISVSGNVVTVTKGSGTGNGISHVVVMWCCPQGSPNGE